MAATKQTYMQRRAAILDDRSASFWLKGALMALEVRDPVDAINDVEILRQMAQLRFDTGWRFVGALAELGVTEVGFGQ